MTPFNLFPSENPLSPWWERVGVRGHKVEGEGKPGFRPGGYGNGTPGHGVGISAQG